MKYIILLVSAFFLLSAESLFADERVQAMYYYDYLQKLLRTDGPLAAEAYLQRAQDYADQASDLPFELARVQMMLERPRREIIALLNHAIATNIWKHNSEIDARLYKAWLLNDLGYYHEALRELELVPQSLQQERLLLAALLGNKRDAAFRTEVQKALSLYPADEDIAALCCRFLASRRELSQADRDIAQLITQRIAGHESLNNMLYLAVPFFSDAEAANHLLRAWFARQSGAIPPAALAPLLNFGVIDEGAAMDILFDSQAGEKSLDKKVVESVFQLLRTNASRAYFLNKLAAFSGVITEDQNGDDIVETTAFYYNGLLVRAAYDGAQERFDGILLTFKAGVAETAEFAIPAKSNTFTGWTWQKPDVFLIEYDTYPAVRSARFNHVKCDFLPDSFYTAPARFEPLCGEGSLSFPQFDTGEAPLTERALYSFASAVERPSKEFNGATEIIRLFNGMIISAVEILNDRIVSETRFTSGQPRSQHVDTDLDGRLETIRYFVHNSPANDAVNTLILGYPEIDYIEVDWDGNGIYEKE